MDLVTPILTVLLTNASLLLSWYALKRRIFATIDQYISGYLDATVENIVKNPEIIAPLVDAITKSGMKSLGIDKEKSLPALNIGGLKIPGYIVQAAMPFLQGMMKKGMVEGAKTAAETALS